MFLFYKTCSGNFSWGTFFSCYLWLLLGHGWRRIGCHSSWQDRVSTWGCSYCGQHLLVWGNRRAGLRKRESWWKVCCQKLTCWSRSWRHRRSLLWVHDWWLCGYPRKVSNISLYSSHAHHLPLFLGVFIQVFEISWLRFSHILCLDRVGRNVAAGMTGGLAYILDEDNTLIPKVYIPKPISLCLIYFKLQIGGKYNNLGSDHSCCLKWNLADILFLFCLRQINREIVKIQRVSAPVGQIQLKKLIEAHVVSSQYTFTIIYACAIII